MSQGSGNTAPQQSQQYQAQPSFQQQGQQDPYQGRAMHPQQVGMEAVPIPNVHQFYIEHRSRFDNRVYAGQFTCKKLSIKDLARIGVKKTQLNGGYHYDESKPGCGIDAETDWMNSMLAHLELSIGQAPIWWNLDNIYDGDLLRIVYEKMMEFENSFLVQRRSPSDGSGGSKSNSSGTSEKPRTAGSVEKVGGSEVQNTLDP